MNQFLEQFRPMATEYLLERRALGPDGLVPEAHAAIEEILRERKVPIPPMPSRAIPTDSSESEPWRSRLAQNAVLVVAALIAAAVAKQFAATWVGVLFTAGVGIYIAVDWFRRQGLSHEERSAEDEEKQAARDGLTELMRSAAAGDIGRVSELLAYQPKVNAISTIGSTALMYAAKNGHAEIVEKLLQAGADPSIRTSKGSSAEDLARKSGHENVVQLLRRGSAQ